MLDGIGLTSIRTPAVSAVAVDRLAPKDAHRLVVFGNGTLHAGNTLASLVAMAVTFVGMFLGQHARSTIRPEIFRLLFFSGMLALGLHFAVIHR